MCLAPGRGAVALRVRVAGRRATTQCEHSTKTRHSHCPQGLCVDIGLRVRELTAVFGVHFSQNTIPVQPYYLK